MDNYLLGQFVKQRRMDLGLSLRDFGKLCGISHTTIDIIERGYDPRTGKPVNITNTTFDKLSTGMGEPIEKLVALSSGAEQKEQAPAMSEGLSETKRKLIEFSQSLSEEQAALVLRVLKSIVEDDS